MSSQKNALWIFLGIAVLVVLWFLDSTYHPFAGKNQAETPNANQQQQTPQPALQPSPGASPKPSPQLPPGGMIEGAMGYPASVIPPKVHVCADNLATNQTYCTDDRIMSAAYKTHVGYKLQVPAGDYYVYEIFAEIAPNHPFAGYKAYYSEFVTCGEKAGCKSHQPVKVTVKAGKTVKDINPDDWYNTSASL